jgi:hypothetical protein
VTGTFRAPETPYLVVRDEQERVFQYLCSLVAWARPARVGRIIFAENSQTTFDFAPVLRYLRAAGKEVELLVFDGNAEAARLGKGYGEGRILEHVYRRSALLRAAPSFYKITGRLFVKNFDKVSEATTAADAFQRKQWDDPARPPKVMTRFFKCSREVFEARLLDAYRQVSDEPGAHVEHVYFKRLSGLDVPDFGARPKIIGQQASTGEVYGPYDDEVTWTARALMPS